MEHNLNIPKVNNKLAVERCSYTLLVSSKSKRADGCTLDQAGVPRMVTTCENALAEPKKAGLIPCERNATPAREPVWRNVVEGNIRSKANQCREGCSQGRGS